ncbi:N-acetylglucosamine-6-phosphate deacetylase [Microbacterium sp. W4I4]|uniref:N-acetylglucosamine-6-phosphate deacetylase n=1 Tax=Microbacterium sp. W4I4 TaxID=3042295 RepID=UPI002780DDA0|nr:amidohydrolase family protein [Microbacterium sp. W4I4]MDQ0614465.1 N-acetylglucosamine-6-phosphate deacetylase [Microbacterium sp. W4I4]
MSVRSWPGLVDLQVNGFHGFDVNSDDVTADTIVALTQALWAEGITSYLPTVITASEDRILHALQAIVQARRSDPLIAHSIAGIHVEGPSLSPEDGARGAHDAAQLRDPSIAELERWQQAADGLIRIVTLAPERAGALEYIAVAKAQGIRISIGHCAPALEQVREAIDAGASLSTHLGNGIHPMLPRHPNHLWAQLAADDLTAMFIADGHHLPADTLTAMIRAKGLQRSILTSDSAALAGCPPGRYSTPVGGDVTVADDGRLSLSGTGLLAGSGTSLRGCIEWALANLPFTEDEVLIMAASNPARMLRRPESSDPDRVDVDLDDGVHVRRVVVSQTTVFES